MSKEKIAERIHRLREKMKERGIQFYLVPTADYHQSEYVGAYFKEREYLTGFTGSAGSALITGSQAYLWTDGRYFLQAAEQLRGTEIRLMKMGEEAVPDMGRFLKDQIKEGQCLGVDGRTVSVAQGRKLQSITKENCAEFHWDMDLVGEIWEDRPAMSKEPAFELDLCYAGESREDKIRRVRREMEKEGASRHLLTSLDDICWLLNIRGRDIAYCPLVLSYCVVEEDKVLLFVDPDKIEKALGELGDSLQKAGVEIHPYEEIEREIAGWDGQEFSLLLDPQKVSYGIYESIPLGVRKIEKPNPEVKMKALKNKVELKNLRIAQRKDAIAHVRFMKWLKENVGKIEMTELSCGEKLEEFRKEQENYLQPGFEPISAYGEHGAIVHYSATKESNAVLQEGGLLLMDTGGGYLEGTTDITRTYAVGTVSREMKEHFTLVVRSNLHLAHARFLQGCSGSNLDILARTPFWEKGLNYNHGTGHGVGYLLNVHEEASAFRWRMDSGSMPLMEGMVITDEPGIYIEGSHGIRLENEVVVQKGEKNEFGQFMYLDIMTYVPFDLDAILPEQMSEQEKEWLNEYHERVYELISPELSKEEKEFLSKYTRKI